MTSAPQPVIRFPVERIPRPASAGASRLDILKGRFRERFGRLLNWTGAPGAIRDTEITDKLTGQTVAVQVGDLFVRVSIDGRDYYFDKVTGRFDGTGAVP